MLPSERGRLVYLQRRQSEIPEITIYLECVVWSFEDWRIGRPFSHSTTLNLYWPGLVASYHHARSYG